MAGSGASGPLTVTNSGTISAAGLGIFLSPASSSATETVTNSGSITSSYTGIAVLMGAGTDTLNVVTGGTFLGRVIAASGTGTVNLSGTGSGVFYGNSEGVDTNPSSPTYGKALQFAGWDGFNTVNVNSGSWTTHGEGNYANVNIANGASLTMYTSGAGDVTPNGTAQSGGLGNPGGTMAIVNNGIFNVQRNRDNAFFYVASDPVPVSYSGSGQVNFTGTGTEYIVPTENFTVTGGTSVSNGKLVVLGSLASNVTVNSGATLQIGAGGTLVSSDGSYTDTGTTGTVTGNIVDNGTLVFNRIDDYTLSGALSGNGTIIKDGAGTLSLGASTSLSNTTIGANAVTLNSGGLSNAGTISASGGSAIVAGSGASGPLTVTNSGTISAAGLGIFLSPASSSATETVTNSGSITSSYTGIAVLMGAGTDTLNVVTGGTFLGRVIAASGTGTVNLSGTGSGVFYGNSEGVDTNPSSPTYGKALQFAGWDGFNTVNVNSGSWTTHGEGNYANVNIANGASLTMYTSGAGDVTPNGTAQSGGLGNPGGTMAIVNNGIFNVQRNRDNAFFYVASDPVPVSYSGSGQVNFTGTGTEYIVPTENFTVTGGTSVSNGKLVVLGSLASNVTVNSGATLQIGAGGTLVSSDGSYTDTGTTGTVTGNIVDNGTLVFNRIDDYTLSGALSGNGTIIKDGAGTVTIAGAYSFTGTTTVNGGQINIAQLASNGTINLTSGTINLTGPVSTIATLNGTGGTINVPTGSTLDVSSGTFGGTISGNGALTKTGTDTLVISGTGNITVAGGTNVTSGGLQVDGSLTSAVVVSSGASLGGQGQITGDVTVQPGGVFSPGDPVTTYVVGPVTFQSGSTYLAQVTPTAQHDLIAVTGPVTITSGAKLEVQPLGTLTQYARLTGPMPIITATGGVTGQFTSVVSDMPLLAAHVTYSANEVDLALTRSDISFASLAATSNQAAVAAAIEKGGYGSALYNALIVQDTAGAQQSYDLLSGELFASLPTLLLGQSDEVRRALDGERGSSGDVKGIWTTLLGGATSQDGGNGIAGAHSTGEGFLSGFDMTAGTWRFALAGGYQRRNFNIAERASNARDEAETIAGSASTALGAFGANFNATYSWHQVHTSRSETLSNFTDMTAGDLHAKTLTLSGEIRYSLKAGQATVEPFGGLYLDQVALDGATESGGASSLAVSSQTRTIYSTKLGIRGEVPLSGGASNGVSLSGSAAWRHASGDLGGFANLAVAGTGQSFTVSGLPFDQDTVEVYAGLSGQIGKRLRIDVGYSGQFSSDRRAYGAKVGLRLAL